MITLSVIWKRIWYNYILFSRYERGVIHGNSAGIDRIYQRKKTGQVRLYSERDMDGTQLVVNGEPPVTLRRRGRHGKLYLGFDET